MLFLIDVRVNNCLHKKLNQCARDWLMLFEYFHIQTVKVLSFVLNVSPGLHLLFVTLQKLPKDTRALQANTLA